MRCFQPTEYGVHCCAFEPCARHLASCKEDPTTNSTRSNHRLVVTASYPNSSRMTITEICDVLKLHDSTSRG